VIQDAVEARIENIWIQQGSETQSAIETCKKNDINPVTGECILMYSEPVKFPHNFHRWIWKIFGKLPR
jgi:predicted CoA-binding protein